MCWIYMKFYHCINYIWNVSMYAGSRYIMLCALFRGRSSWLFVLPFDSLCHHFLFNALNFHFISRCGSFIFAQIIKGIYIELLTLTIIYHFMPVIIFSTLIYHVLWWTTEWDWFIESMVAILVLCLVMYMWRWFWSILLKFS